MARKTFKTIEVDVDAGTHDDRLYNKAFVGLRAALRNRLLPLVRHETPILASLQVMHNKTKNNGIHYLKSSCHRNVFVHLCLIIILFGQLTWVHTHFLWYFYQF